MKSLWLAVSVSAFFTLAACKDQPAVPPVDPEKVVRFSAWDAGAMSMLDKASTSDPMSFLTELRHKEYQPPPEKDQFETTAQYNARIAALPVAAPYGPGYSAFIEPITFDYDADSGTMTFGDSSSDTQADPASYLTVSARPRVTIHAVAEQPPGQLSVRLPPAAAAKYRDAHFELAVVISMNRLKPPVLSGPLWNSAMFHPGCSGGDVDEFRKCVDQSVQDWDMSQFDLSAHVVKLIVFDPQLGGAENPVYTWSS